MLQALHETLIKGLMASHASEETVGAYRETWQNTLMGRSGIFPCPACFMSGKKESPLKAQPARGNTHYVKCEVCNATYSYVEQEEVF